MRSRWTLHPAANDVRTAFRCTISLIALFVIVYGGCNWYTARRHDTLKLYFDWEPGIPLIPEMIWVYVSAFVIFFLPIFCLKHEALMLLAWRMACAILLSGTMFLLFPAQLGFVRAADADGLFAIIHALDYPHNLVPSLHVSMTGLILAALSGASPQWLRYLFAAWFILICASVVLVHQHHVLDVIGGMLVTFAVTRAVRDRGTK